jgi:predicted MFS family arabinose efflux permease
MTRVGLALAAAIGGIYGWTANNAAVLILAFFAGLTWLWLDAHDARHWQRRDEP